MTFQEILGIFGSGCFGLVIGWMTCRVQHDATAVDLKWLAAMIGTVGGGAVTVLFKDGSGLFSGYSIGLAVGFFLRPVFLWLGRRIGIVSPEGQKPAEPVAAPDRGGIK